MIRTETRTYSQRGIYIYIYMFIHARTCHKEVAQPECMSARSATRESIKCAELLCRCILDRKLSTLLLPLPLPFLFTEIPTSVVFDTKIPVLLPAAPTLSNRTPHAPSSSFVYLRDDRIDAAAENQTACWSRDSYMLTSTECFVLEKTGVSNIVGTPARHSFM